MKRYIAELIGTMFLVLLGCGSAAIAGSVLGTIGIALAFGLSVVAMTCAVGGISGCHINPAVSIGMWIDGRIDSDDLMMYIAFQCIGAIIGIALLVAIINSAPNLGGIAATGLGQNGFGSASSVGLDAIGAIIVEIILTFAFVFTFLGVTKKAENSAVAGIAIGLAFTLVYLIGIPLTGGSANPARSFAPALFLGGQAFKQVWVFILAPVVGAVLAGTIFKELTSEDI
ncbi:porin [Methanobrevibacter sp. YE315]|uniref:aquaporin n=1 Tax=Methanobrevibacter sp. YE315 TaxID=1609968 RepID=UPI000764F27F|nr:aquaporin [Methanobrevibacter sp. YE315]AMD17051.1 porin [Methanobrevibacter sp. YE315]